MIAHVYFAYSFIELYCRTFVNAWQSTMKIHEIIAENRIRFAQRLNEMSEDLLNLAKEVEKNRKQVSALQHPSNKSADR